MQPFAPIHKKPLTLPSNAHRSRHKSSEKIQIYSTRDHVILQKGKGSLWCSKDTGTLTPFLSALDKEVNSVPNFEGTTFGLIGKLKFFEDSDWYLLLIDEVRTVGSLPPTGGVVYCIEKVSLLPLTLIKSPVEMNIESYLMDKREKEMKERDKLERRLKEALLHMFNGSQSFYFSSDTDLTQSTQRQRDCGDAERLKRFDRVDDRFFWNKHMISDLLMMCPEADPWIIPVIQGFIQIKEISIPTANQLGVFKKYTPKRRPTGGVSDSPLNMRSYTMVEKDGDNYISRSYSSDVDVPILQEANSLLVQNANGHMVQEGNISTIQKEDVPTSQEGNVPTIQKANVPTVQEGDIPSASDSVPTEPFRDRTSAVSSPTNEYAGMGGVGNINDSTHTIMYKGEDSTPEEVCPLSTNDDKTETCLHSDSPPDHIKDSIINKPTLVPTSPFRHCVANDNTDPPPTVLPSDGSSHSSPTKSAHKSHESLLSYDTDEWIDDHFGKDGRHVMIEEEEDCDEIDSEVDMSEDTDVKKWENGMSSKVKWSPEGLPLITLAIISRRSRHRAGTRYLRRGVDEDGYVANYVETEMVVKIDSHLVSFMIVRGSVPVFWTQSGQKYRPDPVIQRTETETSKAFESHFEQQINIYQEQVIVSLINQSGRERPVGEAYEKQLLILDCPSLTYVAFDFHHHCKVNQWHNINLLLDNTEEYINRQHYFWYNYAGDDVLCRQNGVFRVNCVDCLDRTNVVQSVICREVLQTALQKLGLLYPFDSITGEFLKHYQEIWANNGDIISKQYTGTAAMKGDLTRYGQRKLYGVMKDGYNSAHRFILSLFRDAYRQVIIDLQQGVSPSEALLSLPDTQKGLSGIIDDNGPVIKRRSLLSDAWSTDREEMIAEMIRSCIEQLYPYNPTIPVKGWVLIEALGYSFVKGSVKEEETVLLLSSERGHICVANYNAEFEHISCCIRIPLERIERIVIGQIGNILRSSPRLHMRLFYSLFPSVSCHFTFRTVYSLSPEEDKCILLSIAQTITTLRPQIPIQEHKLSRKCSPPHEGIVYLIAPEEWMTHHEGDMVASGPRSPISPAIDESSEASSQSGSNSNISYVPLTNKSITPNHFGHSRHSSVASSQMGLINDQQHVGYDSDFSGNHDDFEILYSAPNSPNLQRRTSVMSLEERSRILSHTSINDLRTLSEEDHYMEDTLTSSVKKQSYAFSVDDSSDSDGDEDMHRRRMSSVLSTTRTSRIINKRHDSELPPLLKFDDKQEKTLERSSNSCSKLGDLMTNDEIQKYTDKNNTQITDRLSPSKQLSERNERKNRMHSDSAPAANVVIQNSDDNKSDIPTATGWNLSKIKGKLFGKVRSVANSTGSVDDDNETGTSNTVGVFNKSRSPSFGRSKSGKKKTSNSDIGEGNDENDLLKNAMKSSKTRFIIV